MLVHFDHEVELIGVGQITDDLRDVLQSATRAFDNLLEVIEGEFELLTGLSHLYRTVKLSWDDGCVKDAVRNDATGNMTGVFPKSRLYSFFHLLDCLFDRPMRLFSDSILVKNIMFLDLILA